MTEEEAGKIGVHPLVAADEFIQERHTWHNTTVTLEY